MLHNDKNACEFSSEIVEYIYGELAPANRERFETHLADCTACIDEFAAVSNSRYSVYEWRKIEFEPLETPVFEIPFAERPWELVSSRPGWIEALASIFAVARTPMFAAGAAVVLIALGFGAYSFLRTSNSPLVADVPQVSPPAAPPQVVNAPVPSQPEPVKTLTTKKPGPEPVKGAQPVRKAPVSRPQYAVERIRKTDKVPSPSRLAKKAPSLGDPSDEDEDTLRLADLLAEIGG